jgi:2-dehydro-3-deoxygluconokinase
MRALEPRNEDVIDRRSASWDLVTLGETMVAFVAEADRPTHFAATCIGAESNVSISFAQFGGRALWASRLGDDALGRLVYDTVVEHGVEVAVDWDPDRPTGVAIKELGDRGTRVRYYRSESAARGLTPGDVPQLTGAGYLHVTGITPALSSSAAQAVDVAVASARQGSVRVSFDVNLRPALWPDVQEARRRLQRLCREADVVFVGSDEAEALAGTVDPRAFAEVVGISPEQELVFKDGPRRAFLLHGGQLKAADAHHVPVVDVTGAGDAFAAGYLAASLEGMPPNVRLQWGHWNAARVVQLVGDIPAQPTSEELERVRSLFETPLLAEGPR